MKNKNIIETGDLIINRNRKGIVLHVLGSSYDVFLVSTGKTDKFDKSSSELVIKQVDAHRYNASLIFGVPYESVTHDQRRIAKARAFGKTYGTMK